MATKNIWNSWVEWNNGTICPFSGFEGHENTGKTDAIIREGGRTVGSGRVATVLD